MNFQRLYNYSIVVHSVALKKYLWVYLVSFNNGIIGVLFFNE
jgi:hypothetical protein